MHLPHHKLSPRLLTSPTRTQRCFSPILYVPVGLLFISPCLNQPVKPSRPEARALEGGGLAAGLRWRCESCRAPLPEQSCQSPLPRRLLRQVVPSGGGVMFSPRQTLLLLITRLLNVTPVRWKAPRCDRRHPGLSRAGNTGSSIPGMQTLGVRKNNPVLVSYSWL